jgi:hypothetical protein
MNFVILYPVAQPSAHENLSLPLYGLIGVPMFGPYRLRDEGDPCLGVIKARS